MIDVQGYDFALAAAPQTGVKAGNAATIEIDTAPNGVKADYLVVLYSIGTTDTPHTVLKLQETETSGANYQDVSVTLAGVQNYASFAGGLPTAASGNTLWGFFIDLRIRERYQRLLATLGAGANGANVSAVALLCRLSEVPFLVSQKNLAGQVLL